MADNTRNRALVNPPERIHPTENGDESVSLSSSFSSAVTVSGSFSTPPTYSLGGAGSELSLSPSTPKQWETGMKGYLSVKKLESNGNDEGGIPQKVSLSGKLPNLNDSQSIPAHEMDRTVHGGSVFKNMFGKKHRNKYAEGNDLDQSIRSRSCNSSMGSLGSLYRPRQNLDDLNTVIGPGGEIRTLKRSAYIPNVQDRANRETRQKFTEMHNAPAVRGDSASSYLGEDKSTHHGQTFADVAPGGGSSPSEYMFSQRGSLTRHLAPVTEDGSTFLRKRILKPMEGPQSWSKSGDHLLVPAIIKMIPEEVFKFVGQRESAHNTESAVDVNSAKDLAFGKYILGKATQDGSKSPSPSVFVLRQNYLFEFDESDDLHSKPRGIAFLQDSLVSIVNENLIQIAYHEKPNKGRGKMRKIVLLIEHNDAGERERWTTKLQEAANLQIKHLYEYDPSDDGKELGKGRYATIRPARRRQYNGNQPLSWAASANGNSKETLSEVPSSSSYGNDIPPLLEEEYECALKIVDKASFWERVKKGKERADAIVREISVQATLTTLDGCAQNSLRLLSFFETFDHIVLELEILGGNDLFQYISKRETLSEAEAAGIMHDLLTCIAAMNQAGIAHRDLKPANILMGKAENHGKVKLGDFGMATFVGDDDLVHGRCGTPGYVAPEILRAGKNEGYRNKVDVFSAGVTLYVLLSGYEPFYGQNEKELVKDNKECKVEYPQSDWKKISIEGQDLVERMLQRDPTMRITALEALLHPWITRRARPTKNNEESVFSVDGMACCVT